MGYLIITEHSSHEDINITHNLEEMSLLNLRSNRDCTTITFYMEEMPLLNFRRPRQVCITIISDVKEMLLPNSRRLSHGCIIITSYTDIMLEVVYFLIVYLIYFIFDSMYQTYSRKWKMPYIMNCHKLIWNE
jgi:hypothetical protein